MTETQKNPAGTPKPQDFDGLKAELAELANEMLPLMRDLWPRLEDNKYRWELHHFGLDDGYDKFVVSEIIARLVEALRGLGAADLNLMHASVKADGHNPGQVAN
ncbi:Uncharacterised protein [Mycobacteroides abscessus subsp. abscessus]|uniref:Uncharacterized protein n=2 Tax=Mycobacteroides abscessus TaxID=36809 RepID=A0AB33T6L4_9MYCO|nr:hypothetical protein [Mycobacteroides abscessus]EUA46105.1 hypothetical protein I543_1056 [Mycobacteroides abscessus 21]AWG50361.1 hypothetical protein DDT48_13770 [Mycobacteroides abscessus]EIC62433.1 hypothetical protein S7W_23706 [Mycobacteroides abscessus M94]MBE5494477.1 hypothetical protein [Mycobacteroides abscessus]MBN7551049.1 hypothetical protein [Mycobacteroides abscessus subsp. abscessus]